MAEKLFTQEEINRIVAGRLGRERDRLARSTKQPETLYGAIHLMLHQEMCSMKRDLTAEAVELPSQRLFCGAAAGGAPFPDASWNKRPAGEVKVDD